MLFFSFLISLIPFIVIPALAIEPDIPIILFPFTARNIPSIVPITPIVTKILSMVYFCFHSFLSIQFNYFLSVLWFSNISIAAFKKPNIPNPKTIIPIDNSFRTPTFAK